MLSYLELERMPEFVGQMPRTPLPWTTVKPVQRVEAEQQQIQIWGENCQMRLSILAENLIRVRLTARDEFRPRRSWSTTLEDTKFEFIQYTLNDSPELIEIGTAQIRVRIEKNSLKLTCFDQANRSFAEDLGYCWRQGEIAAWKKIEPDDNAIKTDDSSRKNRPRFSVCLYQAGQHGQSLFHCLEEKN